MWHPFVIIINSSKKCCLLVIVTSDFKRLLDVSTSQLHAADGAGTGKNRKKSHGLAGSKKIMRMSAQNINSYRSSEGFSNDFERETEEANSQ